MAETHTRESSAGEADSSWNRDIIVIGASAGGVDALKALVEGLPGDLPAAVFVALHVAPHTVSLLPHILERAGPLPACHPGSGEAIRTGQIYTALPDHHLILQDGHVYVTRGPRENGHRPSVDVLFRSAARCYGPRVIGVVLTGALDDGTAGLAAIKESGGVAIVQEPAEAFHPRMPTSAIENVRVDTVAPLAAIPALLSRLSREKIAGPVRPPATVGHESAASETNPLALEEEERAGTPTDFACPECHGTLSEFHEGSVVRFRCRVGHAYSVESLIASQAESLEAALWTAFRALKESSALAKRIAARARGRGRGLAAAAFEGQVTEADDAAEVIRRVLLQGKWAPRPGAGGVYPEPGRTTAKNR